jgi:hypothetical protein
MFYQSFKKIILIILTFFLSTFLVNTVVADDLRKSKFYSAKLKNSQWYRKNDQMMRRYPDDAAGFYVASGESLACPGYYAISGYFDRKEALREMAKGLSKEVKKNLKEYPKATQKKCSTPNFIIDQGKITSNKHNSKAWNSVKSTVVFVTENKSQGKPLKAFILNDYLHQRTGGFLYNEILQKVCDFSFQTATTATINCGPLGKGKVNFTVTNASRGQFQLFGNIGKTKILATNMNERQIRQKYPKLLE